MSAADSTTVAPCSRYSSSVMPEPSPAPASISTVCPASVSASAPADTRDTRYSLSLISLGTPTIIRFAPGMRDEGRGMRGGKDRPRLSSSLIPHPSSLIPHPSSLIPHPSSLIPHPSPNKVRPAGGRGFIEAADGREVRGAPHDLRVVDG